MNKICYILIFALCAFLVPTHSLAQTSDAGAIGTIGLTAKIGRNLGAKVEQEVRFNQNVTSFDRSLTSVGLDYTLIKKVLKAQVDYDFIYQSQFKKEIHFYEIRHRASAALAVSHNLNAFEFELKTRGQGVWIEETVKTYKVNPRLIWRNKIECAYTIFGSPLKPFVSAEVFCPLNNERGFYMDGFRLVAGAKYRISTHVSIQPFVRYDQDIQQKNPKQMMYGGFGWTYKL